MLTEQIDLEHPRVCPRCHSADRITEKTRRYGDGRLGNPFVNYFYCGNEGCGLAWSVLYVPQVNGPELRYVEQQVYQSTAPRDKHRYGGQP